MTKRNHSHRRYFRKSKRISKIETFIRQSKLGDWSVDDVHTITNTNIVIITTIIITTIITHES